MRPRIPKRNREPFREARDLRWGEPRWTRRRGVDGAAAPDGEAN